MGKANQNLNTDCDNGCQQRQERKKDPGVVLTHTKLI